MKEINELMYKYNEALKPVLKYFADHKDDPLFETEDGKELLENVGGVAAYSTMLNLKVVIMSLEDLITKPN